MFISGTTEHAVAFNSEDKNVYFWIISGLIYIIFSFYFILPVHLQKMQLI